MPTSQEHGGVEGGGEVIPLLLQWGSVPGSGPS